MRFLILVAASLCIAACGDSSTPSKSAALQAHVAADKDNWSVVARPLTAQRQPASDKPIPSVRSLLARLEARVAADPDDAGQWTLLAQSYMHLGQHTDAERAINRAIELGVDEQQLRTQVALATREP
ncbi:MAG: hypothetical protein AAGC71_02590 [Pseudomonadota bacterium]